MIRSVLWCLLLLTLACCAQQPAKDAPAPVAMPSEWQAKIESAAQMNAALATATRYHLLSRSENKELAWRSSVYFAQSTASLSPEQRSGARTAARQRTLALWKDMQNHECSACDGFVRDQQQKSRQLVPGAFSPQVLAQRDAARAEDYYETYRVIIRCDPASDKETATELSKIELFLQSSGGLDAGQLQRLRGEIANRPVVSCYSQQAADELAYGKTLYSDTMDDISFVNESR